MTPTQVLKKQLRSSYFKAHREFVKNHRPAELVALQRKIAFHLAHAVPIGAKRILSYDPFPSELPLDRLRPPGYDYYLPVIRGAGLLARQEGQRASRLLPLAAMDFIIVPGLYVSPEGYRLGRGGGYYDRALRFFPHSKTVFPCYQWQVCDVPVEDWDRRVGQIITEHGRRRCVYGATGQ